MIIEYFKKYKLIVILLLTLVVLVVIRLAFSDLFKQGAEKNALPALTELNVMQPSNPKFLADKSLIVYIDMPSQRFSSHQNFIEINSSELFNKTNLKEMKKNDRVILISDDASLTVRCWMLLAQKGVKNLFVYLTGDEEDFKNQFQPDTTVRAEELELE